jgi:holin (3TMs family)
LSFLAIIPFVEKLLDKVIPDPVKAAEAKFNLLKLAQDGDLARLNADLQLALGQIEVNKIEAQSEQLFKSGWRPAAGWLGVAALAYQFLAQPLLTWAGSVWAFPAPPVLDTFDVMTLLTGMLGLGGFRTYEKLNRVS